MILTLSRPRNLSVQVPDQVVLLTALRLPLIRRTVRNAAVPNTPPRSVHFNRAERGKKKLRAPTEKKKLRASTEKKKSYVPATMTPPPLAVEERREILTCRIGQVGALGRMARWAGVGKGRGKWRKTYKH